MIRNAAILGIIVVIVFAVASCAEDGVTKKETTPPTVSLVTPWDGTTREGIVEVVAEAGDKSGIDRVELYVGNKLYATETIGPYEFEWDMSAISDGTAVSVYVKAVDNNGNAKKSEVVTVTKGSSKPPVATLTSPANGTEVMQGYLLVLSGTATDPEDGELGDANITWKSSIQGPLAQGLAKDYRGLVIGKHTITMIAIDSEGNTDEKTVTVTVTDNDWKFAYVQEGTYTIGLPLFEPRTVRFTRPFIISKTELSIGEFLADYDADLLKDVAKRGTKFEDKNTKTFVYPEDLLTDKYAEYPACFLTIYEIIEYCQTLSARDGLDLAYYFFDKSNRGVDDLYYIESPTKWKPSVYAKALLVEGSNGWRLPTEAEWIIAASGGSAGIKYPWGDASAGGKCNSIADPSPPDMLGLVSDRGICPVKSYKAYQNRFGLYNVAGNVAEMCSDIFLGELLSGIDPVGYSEAREVENVVKGGAFYQNGIDMQIGIRSLTIPFTPDYSKHGKSYNSGFGARLVKSLEIDEDPLQYVK